MTTVTESQVTRYLVRDGNGDYGVVFLDIGETSVTVSATSSFGEYGYHWNATGKDPIDFLRRISFDYAMGKFRGRDVRVFDREAQLKELQSTVMKERRNRTIDQDDAREMFDEAADVCSCTDSTNDFFNQLIHTKLFELGYESDYSAVDAKTKPDPQCVGFWESIWKPLMTHLATTKEIQ